MSTTPENLPRLTDDQVNEIADLRGIADRIDDGDIVDTRSSASYRAEADAIEASGTY